jgi:peptidoglycan/LPS O-acetylase OafA/YrhL
LVRSDDPALTAVRGLAALWVFVYHAWVTAGPQLLIVTLGALALDFTPLASVGWSGVDIFYVLSGFLLFGMFDDWASRRTSGVALGKYAERRALRILPPYYGQLAVLALLGFTTTLVARPTLPDIVSHLTLTHAWFLAYLSSMNGVWWTLSIEAQYYVALPMLAWLIRRMGWVAVIVGGLIVTVAWRAGALLAVHGEGIPQKVWLIEQLPGRIDQFLFGMAAQHFARATDPRAAALRAWLLDRRWWLRLAIAVGPIVMIALAYLLHVDSFFLRYWEGHPWLYFWHTAAALGIATTLCALAIRGGAKDPSIPRRSDPGLLSRALVGMGTISYSFYLWHEVLLTWIGPPIATLVGGSGTLAVFAGNLTIGFAVSLAVATAWYLLLERPFLRQRAKLREGTATTGR